MERGIGKFGIMIVLLLVGVLVSAVNVQPVRASGTIYIRAERSIDPSTARIQRDKNLDGGLKQQYVASEISEISGYEPILDTFETVMEPNRTWWDELWVSDPCVLYDGGKYKMWFSAAPEGTIPPYRKFLAYSESDDGLNWTIGQVVHNYTDHGIGDWWFATGLPRVIKDDTLYRMYHFDHYEWILGEHGSDWSSYESLMNSTDGINWLNHTKVLSALGQDDPQGDGRYISAAAVIYEPGEGYVMWYSVADLPYQGASGEDAPGKFWRCTSSDGISWSNRQLVLPYVPDTWESSIYYGHVVKDNSYTIFYTAYDFTTDSSIGVARSVDGIAWTNRRQLLKGSDLGTNIGGLEAPFLFKDINGKEYLYFNYFDNNDGKTKIGRIQLTSHDIATTNITPLKTVVGQGYSLNVNVTVANQGIYVESFNVTAFYNLTDYTEPQGLVGYWKLDEDSGTTAYDSSGYNNNGTLYNDPVWIDGKIGNALSFDGGDDCVEIYAPLLKQLPLTLSAWVKPELRADGTDFPNNVISNDRPGYAGHGFGVNVWAGGSQMKVECECVRAQPEDAWRTVPGVSFNAGNWYHVAVVYTSGNVKSYINGQLVDDFSYSQEALDAEDYVRIGKHNDDTNYGTNRFFNGAIDEVKIYSKALNKAKIIADMAQNGEIGKKTVTLTSGNSTTLTFTWNTAGFAMGNYTVTAYAIPVPGETDTTDNNYTSSIVTVTIPGDVDGDFDVDILDVVKITGIYGSKRGESQFNENSDIDGDGVITILDVVIACIHYGEKDP